MKTKFYFFLAVSCLSTNLFSQTKVIKPVTAKTVVPAPTVKTVESKGPSAPADLKLVTIEMIIGDDGKDVDSKLLIELYDQNNRLAALYGKNDGSISAISSGAYSPGEVVTLPVNLIAMEPNVNGRDNTFTLREADFNDFNFSGGNISIDYETNYDALKIKSFTVNLSFGNDVHSPHKITWGDITLSPGMKIKKNGENSVHANLKFDKNFNPIQ